MQMTEIKRESLKSKVVVVTDERMTLAAKVAEVLKYNVLMNVMSPDLSEKSDSMELAKVLAELDIDVLNPEDVRMYQAQMQLQRTRELCEVWIAENGSMTPESYNYFRGPCWNRTKIEEYKLPVPEFVLNKAVQIKEKCPEAEFYIQHLEDHPDPFLVVEIPKAGYGHKERYFVEVWDEPKFEASR